MQDVEWGNEKKDAKVESRVRRFDRIDQGLSETVPPPGGQGWPLQIMAKEEECRSRTTGSHFSLHVCAGR
jgi:hypothetical protein